MKSKILLLIFVMFLIFTLTGCVTPSIYIPDEVEVEMVIQSFGLALNNQNWDKAKSYCKYDSQAYTIVEAIESYVDYSNPETFTYQVDIVDIEVYAAFFATAHVSIISTYIGKRDGYIYLEKDWGTWKIYAHPHLTCDICNLPIYPINIKVYTGSESYFNIEFENIGSGYDIYDGIWIGWCADSETTIETNEWYQGYIYSSYNPSDRYGIDWPKINWIINNKKYYSADYIQNAIWHFTNGLDPNGLAIAAEAYTNFCPQVGQKYIAIVDIPGIQLTFIEVPAAAQEVVPVANSFRFPLEGDWSPYA